MSFFLKFYFIYVYFINKNLNKNALKN